MNMRQIIYEFLLKHCQNFSTFSIHNAYSRNENENNPQQTS